MSSVIKDVVKNEKLKFVNNFVVFYIINVMIKISVIGGIFNFN